MSSHAKMLGRMMLALILLGLALIVVLVTQPVLPPARRAASTASPDRLRQDVEALVALSPRDLDHPERLDRAAEYMRSGLESAGARVSDQPFTVAGRRVRNVLADFGAADGPLLVVGAHFDAFGGMPGADDNASGSAGLLELARLLAVEPTAGRVTLAAYTLEEPPSFGSALMGSAYHAASLRKEGARVTAMLSLEMIGDFSDAFRSQGYPFPGMSLLYGTRGNYIAVAGRLSEIGLARRVKSAMLGVSGLQVQSINAPPRFGGIDLSDHASFWKEGIPALLVTDTAFYRNARYHGPEDTPDRLDYVRMARVVSGVHRAVLALAGPR